MSRYLHWGLLCLLASLVLGLEGRGVRANELRVSWAVPPRPPCTRYRGDATWRWPWPGPDKAT